MCEIIPFRRFEAGILLARLLSESKGEYHEANSAFSAHNVRARMP